MASNTTYRAALTIKPQYIVAFVGAVWLLALAAIAGQHAVGENASEQRAVTHYPLLEQNTSSRPLRERFEVSLSNADSERYHALYKAHAQADWQSADALIAELDNNILLGAALANRYLSEDYVSSYNELEQWLVTYSDHPKASRIHRLAMRKQPSDTAAPKAAENTSKLKGYGTVSGIGHAERPAAWAEAMRLYKTGKYSAATKHFVAAAKQTDNHWYISSAHFWAGRSANAAGNNPTAHYEKASGYGYTLYGTLARHALGNAMLEEAYAANSEHSVYDKAAVARASAYTQLGMPALAEKELRHLFTASDRDGREQLMHIAAALELPALQLRISQSLWYNTKSNHAGDYPMPAWELAERSAQTPMGLLFAIARQESGFNPNAKSRVGAKGVMQLMPKTASYIIERNRLDEVRVASADDSYPTSAFKLSNLDKPEVNLAIGAHYIDYLADKNYIDNNLIYTLTAYNAGPGKLRKWKRELETSADPLLFIESIPYRETRHYVQQVLNNHMMYALLDSGDTSALDALASGQWPHVYE